MARNRPDLKNVIAIFVIISSFLVAVGLALISNNRSTYWVATRPLTPGHMVDSQDFQLAKGAFAGQVSGYLTERQNPVGFVIAKAISPGEYLHRSALMEDGTFSSVKLLSFAASAADLPSGINIGDAVNLYQVINDNGDGSTTPSQLIIEDVYIVDMNRKNENLGGVSIVTVAIPNEFVERALDATRKGRIVVVANHG